jgi:methionyl-tRNA synthetase
MSKSLGNVVRPLEMKKRYGMDTFRYFLLREMAFGQDGVFSMDAFVMRVNADLANNLGNLVSRILAMQKKYFAGVVQPLVGTWAEEDVKLSEMFLQTGEDLRRHMEKLSFHRALESIWTALDRTNQYIVQTSPFLLMKDPEKHARVGEILHHLLEALRTTSNLLAPFLPETAREIRSLLAMPEDTSTGEIPWGSFYQQGHRVRPPKVLFPRIEEDTVDQEI